MTISVSPGLGLVRRRHGNHTYPDGKPVKASVVHECGMWYATVCYKVDLPPRREPERMVAMDRNCGQVAVVDSDGAHDLHRRPDTRLLQTTVKRARSKLHQRIRNAANPWPYRLTRHVADKDGLLVLEKLNTQGMTRSAKGTVAAPDGNVQQKAGLNRSILATDWGEIEQRLCYKTRVVYVNPAYTSRRCCRCGQVDKASRRSQPAFHCTSCGYQANGDLEHPGLRGWGNCTGRGILARDLYDP